MKKMVAGLLVVLFVLMSDADSRHLADVRLLIKRVSPPGFQAPPHDEAVTCAIDCIWLGEVGLGAHYRCFVLCRKFQRV